MGEDIKKLGFDLSNIVVDDKRVEEYERQQAEQWEKDRRATLEHDYKHLSGAPAKYLKESLETYKPLPENEKTFNWLCGFVSAVEQKKNTKNLVYLGGENGTGKTHLGCGMIRRLGGKMVTSLELCITFDSCRDFNSPMTRIQYLKKLCSNDVLVIDEVGRGIPAIEKLVYPYLVNEFYGSGKLLVYLGNIERNDFDKIIGNAGADRFAEVGIYFSLIGDSHRRIKNK